MHAVTGCSTEWARPDVRAAGARAALERCELCELRCGVDRLRGTRGKCRLAVRTPVFRCYVSYAEEVELSPALMVYLGGCNFRCRFCTQAPRCFHPDDGVELTSADMAARIDADAARVRWINFVGGEPSLHPHALLRLREMLGSRTPWLLNTNGYFTPMCLQLLDPLFQLHLVDFKFGNDDCARHLAGVPRYLETLRRNLKAVYATGVHRLLVRHLLMPGHAECCTRRVVQDVARLLPGVRFHLMGSYVPNHRAMRDPALGRTAELQELQWSFELCRNLGLNLVDTV